VPEAAQELQAAYEAGDFARLRKLADAALRDASGDKASRALARTFLARVQVDPAVWWLLGCAFALFCGIVLRYAVH
jgi:hypothetical protein